MHSKRTRGNIVLGFCYSSLLVVIVVVIGATYPQTADDYRQSKVLPNGVPRSGPMQEVLPFKLRRTPKGGFCYDIYAHGQSFLEFDSYAYSPPTRQLEAYKGNEEIMISGDFVIHRRPRLAVSDGE